MRSHRLLSSRHGACECVWCESGSVRVGRWGRLEGAEGGRAVAHSKMTETRSEQMQTRYTIREVDELLRPRLKSLSAPPSVRACGQLSGASCGRSQATAHPSNCSQCVRVPHVPSLHVLIRSVFVCCASRVACGARACVCGGGEETAGEDRRSANERRRERAACLNRRADQRKEEVGEDSTKHTSFVPHDHAHTCSSFFSSLHWSVSASISLQVEIRRGAAGLSSAAASSGLFLPDADRHTQRGRHGHTAHTRHHRACACTARHCTHEWSCSHSSSRGVRRGCLRARGGGGDGGG